ncbi:sce7726 family protein [Enterococcus sp.]|uniref:sce7726 family protein n=1 Tax=Enterococcus sp. TaxID=35783 RepID=UPI00290C842E|nr:sce7726 family protein [Enterococcus sp.]MDU5337224.1 sce7726 family protein [Enterococcus sp.]
MRDLDYSLLTRVFSRKILNDFTNTSLKSSSVFEEARKTFIPSYDGTDSVANDFEKLYSVLHKNYRNEYYYKNTLLNKLLLGVHSVNTTTALTELPIGEAKADFVLINGKAVVYEIKTELDNFERLENQIINYYKAFDHVTVITSESQFEKVSDIYANSSVGVSLLTKRGNIRSIVPPVRQDNFIDLGVIFAILRKREYEDIIMNYYGFLPSVSQFEYYNACKSLFLDIKQDVAYNYFMQKLKERHKVNSSIFFDLPKSLKSLAYFSDLTDHQLLRLKKNIL